MVCCLLVPSCKKEEGIGGKASIYGNVQTVHYSGTNPIDTTDAPDVRVYITYGDDSVHNDDMRTHYNGDYRFEFLYKGNYTIHAYGECFNCAENVEAEIQTVTINDRKEEVQVPTIYIKNY